jgi:hypothetical protein
MPISYTVNDDGELLEVPTEESTTDSPASQAEAKPAKRSHYKIAQDLVQNYTHQLAYNAGEFYAFIAERGWVCITSLLYSDAARECGTAPDRTVIPILQNRLSIPANASQETVYWRMTGEDKFKPNWVPFHIEPSELLFADCIYDVITGETREHPGCIFGPMINLPWVIDEEIEEPRNLEFESLIEHAIPEPEVRRHFQEVVSTLLQPHVPLRGQIVLWGEPYSGKTTIATALGCCPAGRVGLSQMQETEIVEDRFASCNLVNRFANVSDDSGQTNKWVDFMKRYTSGSMNVRPMYQKPVSVTPTAKLISTCNHIQGLSDASSACTDRMLVFRLDRCIEKVHGGRNDAKMTAVYWSSIEQREGVLTWLVDGLARLRKRGSFDVPEIVQNWKRDAEQEGDPVVDMIRTKLTASSEGFVASSELKSLFPPVTDGKKLGQYLRRLFPGVAQEFRKVDGKSVRGWVGVEVVEE